MEWYRRLRNMLYHEGNGLTVEARVVHAYAAVAGVLIDRLYGMAEQSDGEGPDLLRDDETYQFLSRWSQLEQILGSAAVEAGIVDDETPPAERAARAIDKLVPVTSLGDVMPLYQALRHLRSMVAHGRASVSTATMNELSALEDLLKRDLPFTEQHWWAGG